MKTAKGHESFHDKPLPGKSGKVRTKLDFQKKQGTFYLRPVGQIIDSWADLNHLQIFPREFLLGYRSRRIATLTEEARHHMREKLAAYHTRFGPDERYFLTDEEQTIASEAGWLR